MSYRELLGSSSLPGFIHQTGSNSTQDDTAGDGATSDTSMIPKFTQRTSLEQVLPSFDNIQAKLDQIKKKQGLISMTERGQRNTPVLGLKLYQDHKLGMINIG